MTKPTQGGAIHYSEKFRRFWGVQALSVDERLAWIERELRAHDDAEMLAADFLDQFVFDDVADPV